MPFMLTADYIAKLSFGQIHKDEEYRVAGFDLKKNVILLSKRTQQKFTVPSSDATKFRMSPPADNAFEGTKQSDVAGFFEGQKTNITCWACALANVLSAMSSTFINEEAVVELLNASNSTSGPNHEEYVRAIETVLGKYLRNFTYYVHQAGQQKNWLEICKSLKNGCPVICSVNRRSHVVILLACTSNLPQWVLYFEPTGGSFKKMELQTFIAERNPDWAYSFCAN